MIWSLLYLTASRPDIIFNVGLCARFQANPKESHLMVVKMTLRYLKGTLDICIWYPRGYSFDLVGYVDVDYAGFHVDIKSTSGTAHFLGSCLVSWGTKKQNSVALSTAETEYMAAASCCAQLLWIRQQLRDYGIFVDCIFILCDNTSDVNIATNPCQHKRTKYIDIRYHFLRDNVEKGNISIIFCKTEDQIEDIFTKALSRDHFENSSKELLRSWFFDSVKVTVIRVPLELKFGHLISSNYAYVPAAKNTSKSTKVKATPRKSVKNVKVVSDATTQVDTVVKEAMVHGESMPITTSQELTIEKSVDNLEKEVDTTIVVPVVEGKGSKEPAQKEAYDGLSFSWMEDEDDNGGEKEEGVVGGHEENTTQDIANEEEKSENEGDSGEDNESEIEEEGNSENEGEAQEKASESERVDEESEEENENMSEKSKGSMTIGNTVIAPSEEASGEKRTKEFGPLLTPFTGDKEVSSIENDLPLYEVGKKPRKTPVKATESAVPTSKEVAPLAKTPLTRSERKVVDKQIIKEFRSAKKPRKKVLIVESMVELDGEDEFKSVFPEMFST
ncbi:uncharacterized protein [Nicotiana tomentosiformis]|uniref:uncharacterized protein n=1 Tax=Nicotiana tomentosiformis TaxID=4098 RepID=UPI00388C95E8